MTVQVVKYRFTASKFERMIEKGVFEDGVHLELIDGVINHP
jgi:hypothetical protein